MQYITSKCCIKVIMNCRRKQQKNSKINAKDIWEIIRDMASLFCLTLCYINYANCTH